MWCSQHSSVPGVLRPSPWLNRGRVVGILAGSTVRRGAVAYVVAAMWRAKEGKADDLVQVIAAMTPLSRQEPACIPYEPHRSVQDPRLFFLYEVYADEAGYQSHRNTAHFQRYVV